MTATATTPRKALHTTEPVAPIVYRQPSKRRHAAQMFRMKMAAAPVAAIVRDPRTDAEYTRYVDNGFADTDGYFAPISREAFYRLYASHYAA